MAGVRATGMLVDPLVLLEPLQTVPLEPHVTGCDPVAVGIEHPATDGCTRPPALTECSRDDPNCARCGCLLIDQKARCARHAAERNSAGSRNFPYVAGAEGVEDQVGSDVAADPPGAGLDPPALGRRRRVVLTEWCRIHRRLRSLVDVDVGVRVQRCNSQAAGTVIAVVTKNSPGIDPVNVGQCSTSAIANSIAITCNRKIS